MYFGLDYTVEAALQEAIVAAGNSLTAGIALRRQADRILPPFLRRVWLPAMKEAAVDDSATLSWLNRPYDPARGDLNLNPDRIERLVGLFADRITTRQPPGTQKRSAAGNYGE